MRRADSKSQHSSEGGTWWRDGESFAILSHILPQAKWSDLPEPEDSEVWGCQGIHSHVKCALLFTLVGEIAVTHNIGKGAVLSTWVSATASFQLENFKCNCPILWDEAPPGFEFTEYAISYTSSVCGFSGYLIVVRLCNLYVWLDHLKWIFSLFSPIFRVKTLLGLSVSRVWFVWMCFWLSISLTFCCSSRSCWARLNSTVPLQLDWFGCKVAVSRGSSDHPIVSVCRFEWVLNLILSISFFGSLGCCDFSS